MNPVLNTIPAAVPVSTPPNIAINNKLSFDILNTLPISFVNHTKNGYKSEPTIELNVCFFVQFQLILAYL